LERGGFPKQRKYGGGRMGGLGASTLAPVTQAMNKGTNE